MHEAHGWLVPKIALHYMSVCLLVGLSIPTYHMQNNYGMDIVAK